MLVTSIFSFSYNVFHSSHNKLKIFGHILFFFIGKCFQFGVKILSFGKEVNNGKVFEIVKDFTPRRRHGYGGNSTFSWKTGFHPTTTPWLRGKLNVFLENRISPHDDAMATGELIVFLENRISPHDDAMATGETQRFLGKQDFTPRRRHGYGGNSTFSWKTAGLKME